MVSGNLTMKDQTHNVTFPASVSFNENTMSLQSETFAIDRTKWGVNYGSKSVFDNLGDKFINDEIESGVASLHAILSAERVRLSRLDVSQAKGLGFPQRRAAKTGTCS